MQAEVLRAIIRSTFSVVEVTCKDSILERGRCSGTRQFGQREAGGRTAFLIRFCFSAMAC